MKAECFRCHEGYNSVLTDDLAGDGLCPKCGEIKKKVAFDLDMKFGQRTLEKFREPSRMQKIMANTNARINLRDLGIVPHD